MRAALALVLLLVGCKFTPPPGGDDDGGPQVGFVAATLDLRESDGAVFVKVRVDQPSDDDITVEVAVVDGGTATLSNDFTAANGVTTLAAGTTEATFMLTLVQDVLPEAAESIVLRLANPTNAHLGISELTITVSDDDPCIGEGSLQVCPDPLPTDPATISGRLDTSAQSSSCSAPPPGWITNQTDACFVYGRGITANGLIVTGTRPLVLVSTESLSVSGLDASSHGTVRGPGTATKCNAFAQDPGASSGGAAGGAGGSFATVGGNGGAGNSTSQIGTAANTVAPSEFLHPGCDGQSGGTGDDVADPPGMGGGVVYLVAADKLMLTGVINASGGGAPGNANSSAGGSGGGSGGMIAMFGRSLMASGLVLIANGGGAGSGSGANNGGNKGNDPDPNNPLSAATGGNNNNNFGGRGGNGATVATGATNGGQPNSGGEGGGGGGGGGGYVRSNLTLTQTPGVTVSAGVIDQP